MSNWLKLSIRRFLRNKVNSFINIFGLALGMMVFLLIFIYVRHEFSYDNFHNNADHVFRLIKKNSLNGDNYLGNALQAVLPAPLAEVLKNDIPGITHVARLDSRKTLIVEAEGKTYYEDTYHAADEDLFSILTFNVLYGNNGNTLRNPYTVAISSSTAVRYFGTENAIGKVLELTGNRGSFGQYTVDMVFSEFPTNSSYQFNIILRFEDHAKIAHTNNLTWNNYNHYFFVRTAEKSSVSDIQEQIKSFFIKRESSGNASVQESNFWLQPIANIYLGPDVNFSNTPKNSRDRLYILISIAVFVVAIAGVNYVNLTTARAVKRAKEVGVRKVSGASQSNLVYQFLADALSISFLAMLIAGLSIWSLLPAYRDFLGTNLPFDLVHDNVLLSSVLLIPLCFGLFAGSYPAFVLSSFKPVNILKGNFSRDSDDRLLRDGLTVFQFVISGTLIFAVIVINQQLSYIEKHNPGYDRKHILRLNLSDVGVREKKEIFVEELRKNPSIVDVSITSYFPNAVNTQQGREWKGVEGTTNVSFYSVNADHHYLDVFNIKLSSGRNFSPNNPADNNAFLINETAAKTYGWDDPLGMEFTGEGGDGDTVTIIGVIEDIHITNYRNIIKPFRIGYVRPWSSQLAIKIVSNDIANTLAFIEDSYKKFATSKIPYSISFFDEDFGKVYKSDQQLSTLINLFSMIAALVACLGLYGLSVYTVSQRMKEVGVRKILGAKVSQLSMMLSRRFLFIVLLAFVIASPVAYYFMNNWLEGFAYHTIIKPMVFILTVLVMVIIAGVTVGAQAWRAATTNPTEVLRSE